MSTNPDSSRTRRSAIVGLLVALFCLASCVGIVAAESWNPLEENTAFAVVYVGFMGWFLWLSRRNPAVPGFWSGRLGPAIRPSGVVLPLILVTLGTATLWELLLEAIDSGLAAWLFDDDELYIWQPEGGWPLADLISVGTAVLLAPIVEEFAFRGLLLTRWRRRYGARKAVLWTAVLFGLLHPQAPISGVLFGWICGVLALRTGSLLAPIALHLFWNTLAVTLEWLDTRAGLIEWPVTPGAKLFFVFVLGPLGLLWLWKRYRFSWALGDDERFAADRPESPPPVR